jgi:hypothetical protein
MYNVRGSKIKFQVIVLNYRENCLIFYGKSKIQKYNVKEHTI